MKRVAWFHVVIDAEDEESAVAWLNAMAELVDQCAQELSRGIEKKVKLVSVIESGQSFVLSETEPLKRDDV